MAPPDAVPEQQPWQWEEPRWRGIVDKVQLGHVSLIYHYQKNVAFLIKGRRTGHQ